MSDFLHQMAKASAERAELLPASLPASSFEHPVFPLRTGTFDVIAEIKDHSPAEGALATAAGRPRTERALEYAHGGAAAISVLTEPSRFAGDAAHVTEVAAAVASLGVPVMRKDFLVDARQVREARACGASGVLLIAAMLADDELLSLLDCAHDHGLFVLLESFDEDDLRRSAALLDEARYADRAAASQLLVGINTRNLRTLAVDPDRLERLSALLPGGAIAVAESGLHVAADAARVAGWGYSMALVGTALMRSADPRALVADMVAAGRRRLAA